MVCSINTHKRVAWHNDKITIATLVLPWRRRTIPPIATAKAIAAAIPICYKIIAMGMAARAAIMTENLEWININAITRGAMPTQEYIASFDWSRWALVYTGTSSCL